MSRIFRIGVGSVLAATSLAVGGTAAAATTTTKDMTIVRVVSLVSNKPDATGHVQFLLENGQTISVLERDRDLVLQRAHQDAAPEPVNLFEARPVGF
jgi:hypothetical protein